MPGPPREIEAIWRDHIQGDLFEKTKNLNKLVTKSWDTLGVGESEVAFLVQELLKDKPRDKYLEIGYRVHLPYVEVKITFEKNEEFFWLLWLDKIDRALAPITVARDFSDVAQIGLEKIQDLDFTFYDFVSDGYLHARLSPFLKKLKWQKILLRNVHAITWTFECPFLTEHSLIFFQCNRVIAH